MKDISQFLDGGHYLQFTIKQTVRSTSSVWTIEISSTLGALVLLRIISLVNPSIVTKQPSFFSTYVTELPIGCMVEKSTKACIAPAHATGMLLFFKIVSSPLLFKCIWNVLEKASRRDDDFAPKLPANALGGAPGLVQGNESGSWGVWEISSLLWDVAKCALPVSGPR